MLKLVERERALKRERETEVLSVIFYVPFSVVNKVSGGDFYGVACRPAAIESAIVEGRDFQCVLGTQSLQSRCNPFPDVLRLLECAGNIFSNHTFPAVSVLAQSVAPIEQERDGALCPPVVADVARLVPLELISSPSVIPIGFSNGPNIFSNPFPLSFWLVGLPSLLGPSHLLWVLRFPSTAKCSPPSTTFSLNLSLCSV